MSLIMLVDDDADILRLTERWVVKAGYETITVTSGKDALEMTLQNLVRSVKRWDSCRFRDLMNGKNIC
ncbi:MAG: hypothetical protein IK123_02010 [Lachnospiraceae bacterium]|nr:hypothetical protein [Lachnospiraceae bacterium]